MKLAVLDDRVFVRPDALPEVSEGGLHLVHHRRHSVMYGTIVAVGAGPLTPSGHRYAHVVRVGDRVIFPTDVGEELYFEQDLLLVMRETDLLATIH